MEWREEDLDKVTDGGVGLFGIDARTLVAVAQSATCDRRMGEARYLHVETD